MIKTLLARIQTETGLSLHSHRPPQDDEVYPVAFYTFAGRDYRQYMSGGTHGNWTTIRIHALAENQEEALATQESVRNAICGWSDYPVIAGVIAQGEEITYKAGDGQDEGLFSSVQNYRIFSHRNALPFLSLDILTLSHLESMTLDDLITMKL